MKSYAPYDVIIRWIEGVERKDMLLKPMEKQIFASLIRSTLKPKLIVVRAYNYETEDRILLNGKTSVVVEPSKDPLVKYIQVGGKLITTKLFTYNVNHSKMFTTVYSLLVFFF